MKILNYSRKRVPPVGQQLLEVLSESRMCVCRARETLSCCHLTCVTWGPHLGTEHRDSSTACPCSLLCQSWTTWEAESGPWESSSYTAGHPVRRGSFWLLPPAWLFSCVCWGGSSSLLLSALTLLSCPVQPHQTPQGKAAVNSWTQGHFLVPQKPETMAVSWS